MPAEGGQPCWVKYRSRRSYLTPKQRVGLAGIHALQWRRKDLPIRLGFASSSFFAVSQSTRNGAMDPRRHPDHPATIFASKNARGTW